MVPPTHAIPPALQAGLLIVLALHLAWSGLLAGSGTVAVAVDALGDRHLRTTAAAILRLGRPGLLTVAWMEVTATLVVAGSRILQPSVPQTAGYWGSVLLPLVLGIVLLTVYGALLERDLAGGARPTVGLAGVGLVLGSCFMLCSGSGMLLQPEGWPTSEPAYRLLLTWSGTGRFAEFTCLSLAAAGGAILLLAGREGAGVDAGFARRFGRGMALLFLGAWPLALLSTHAGLPAIALSPALWATAGVGVAVAGGAAWIASGPIAEQAPGRVRALLGAVLLLFVALAASDQLARASALDAPTLAGVVAPPPPAAPLEVAAAPAARLAAGKAVFDRVCHLCHRFDKKLVGPPLDSVVPKYRKDPAALRAFIRSPVKKDPKFPAMPKPAVNEAEIEAVAAYVLEQAKP
jgi:mono/diheme cytochrome c family protein